MNYKDIFSASKIVNKIENTSKTNLNFVSASETNDDTDDKCETTNEQLEEVLKVQLKIIDVDDECATGNDTYFITATVINADDIKWQYL